MSKNNQAFIKTSDEHTAEVLRESGFVELAKENKYWVFLNDEDQMAKFSDESEKKMHYSNKLWF